MRILACIDLSPISDRVADEALALARASSAELTLLHAARTEPVLTSGGVSPPGGHRVPPPDLTERRTKMEAMIDRLRASGAKVDGGVKLSDEVLPRFIVDEASAIGASYIVIGSHGYSRVFELLLGSVTSGVVREARIPVVIVPARAA
jgi:nucleotide-binding universal stress UspA family protein